MRNHYCPYCNFEQPLEGRAEAIDDEIVDIECPNCGFPKSFFRSTEYIDTAYCPRCGKATYINKEGKNHYLYLKPLHPCLVLIATQQIHRKFQPQIKQAALWFLEYFLLVKSQSSGTVTTAKVIFNLNISFVLQAHCFCNVLFWYLEHALIANKIWFLFPTN